MSKHRIAAVVVFVVSLLALSASAGAQQPPEGFVPVDQLPNQGQEQLPAAPLVAAAYAFAWGAVLFYVWTVWRRVGRVERELETVRARIER